MGTRHIELTFSFRVAFDCPVLKKMIIEFRRNGETTRNKLKKEGGSAIHNSRKASIVKIVYPMEMNYLCDVSVRSSCIDNLEQII